MSEARAAKARQANPNKRKEIAWILYDVGNSAFTLLVSTVLPIYFNYLVTSAGLAATDATAIWGYAASAVTLCVAVLSPILGSFADDVGRKKPLFFFRRIKESEQMSRWERMALITRTEKREPGKIRLISPRVTP